MTTRQVDSTPVNADSETVSNVDILFNIESLRGLLEDYATTHRLGVHVDTEHTKVMSILTELSLSY